LTADWECIAFHTKLFGILSGGATGDRVDSISLYIETLEILVAGGDPAAGGLPEHARQASG